MIFTIVTAVMHIYLLPTYIEGKRNRVNTEENERSKPQTTLPHVTEHCHTHNIT